MKGKEWKSDNTKPPSLTRDIFFSYSISDYFLPNDVGQVWKWVVLPLILILTMQFRPEGFMGKKELSDFFPFLKKFYQRLED